MKSICLFVLLATAAPVLAEEGWADTETTTKLWEAISAGDMEKLKGILDEDDNAATARAADGRGPLFWATEYKQEEMIALLKEAGADENAKDADGKTAADIQKAGEMTEFMKKKRAEEAAAAQKLAEQQAAAVRILPFWMFAPSCSRWFPFCLAGGCCRCIR